MIVSGRISNIDIWRSVSEEGVPTGWLDASKIVPEIINEGTHEVEKQIVKTVKDVTTTPGYYVVKSSELHEKTVNELNPLVAAAETGLAASGLGDLNDALRFTRGQESIKRRQPKLLEQMRKEDAKSNNSQEAVARDEETDNSSPTTKNTRVEKLRETKSFQRSNKTKHRFYEHSGEAMRRASEIKAERAEGVTVFEGFTGNKKEDMKSGYDENLIGVNDREEPIDERY